MSNVNRAAYFIALAIVMGSASNGPAAADSIDDAEAKRRGVPVEQVQLERAQQQIKELEGQVAQLKAEVAQLKGQPVSGVSQPASAAPKAPPATARRAFVPTDSFASRAKARGTTGATLIEAQKVDQQIAAYLLAHPDISEATAAAMYSGTPKPGMTEEQVMVFCRVIHTSSENLTSKTVTVEAREGAPPGSPLGGYAKWFQLVVSNAGLVRQVDFAGP